MAVIAGKVAPRFMGAYNSSTTYQFYDAVTHNNKLYFCKVSGTVGKTPSGVTDDYWFLSLDGTFADASSLGGKPASEYALTADLANYLPLTGGKINGQLTIENTTADTETTLEVSNALRKIYIQAQKTGNFRIYDSTNGKAIISSSLSGNTVIFEGTATGNLPLTGGTLKKNAVIDFEKTDDSTLSANIAIGAGGNSFGVWERGDTNRGVKLDLTECQAWNGSEFLHTGNSAKVAIQSSAPTDTTALWVDAANKKVKAYIDGAWTAMVA